MIVSVIVCTWNNCLRLEATLGSLYSCTIPPNTRCEFIVVNNNCSDNTDDIVAKYIDRMCLKYISEPLPGLSRAKNAGCRVARGELLIFTDDDVTPAKHWIATYVAAFRQYRKGHYFGGPVESEFESQPDPELLDLAPCSVRGLDYGNTDAILNRDQFFLSANWACPREYLVSVGGFDNDLGLNSSSTEVRVGEETDVMKKLNLRHLTAYYLADAKIRHFVPSHKCTPSHILARIQAGFALYTTKGTDADSGSPTVREMLHQVGRLTLDWFNWRLETVNGRDANAKYIRFRYSLLIMKRLLQEKYRA